MNRSSRRWTDSPGNDLLDLLGEINADVLRQMLPQLPIPKPRPTRKAEMAAAIEDRLAGDSLRNLWDRLGELEQLAVREALYDPGGQLDRVQFQARYGALPAGVDGHSRTSSLLGFFLYAENRYAYKLSVMPRDLGERLREFVPPPPEVELAAEEELPEAVERLRRYHTSRDEPKHCQVALLRRDMEQTAQRDLSTVLRLVDLGRVAVSARTRRPSAAAVQRISDELGGGDFFGPDDRRYHLGQGVGPVRAFAWPLLLQAGNLAEIHGSKLALTKSGRTALGKPPAETLRSLWQRWITHGILDEFSRIDVISGQRRGKGRSAMTAMSGRRPVVDEALARCPVGLWVRFDEFSRFMRAEGYQFEVTHDPWKLYIGDVHYGGLGYAGYHDWEILQDRYILCLLFEYAATLGLVDVAYTHPDNARLDFTDLMAADSLHFLSRYDGLEYFRLNSLGAYCLGMSEEYEPGTPLDRTPLKIFSDLRLCADTPMSPEERLMLETCANAEAEGVWRLDRGRILEAIENGHDVEGLRAFLAARDEQPLPERVEGFLRSIERDGNALREQGRALLIECASEEIAARLATDKRVSKLCLPAGKKHLAVTGSETAFRKAIRELGLGMRRK